LAVVATDFPTVHIHSQKKAATVCNEGKKKSVSVFSTFTADKATFTLKGWRVAPAGHAG
jgi:hypothetical protein